MTYEPRRILVTGGAGFIGSAFVRHVLATADDLEVTTYDALTYAGNPANLAAVADDARHRFVHGDVRDADDLRAAMRDHDTVVHFAAESHVDRSIDDPTPFLSTNVTGTGVVLDVARHLDVDRVLHVSTDEVYGSVPTGSCGEDDPLRPTSPYAVSKAAGDLLATSHVHTFDAPVLVTRPTNTFGPYHHPEKVIPLFVTNLLDGLSVPLYGDGSNVRDWLFVEDHVAAQWHVLTHGEPGSIHNIGAGNEVTNLDLTRRLLALCDRDEDAIEFVTDRPGHDLRYSVDTTRVRRLGWTPGHDLDEALARTVAWYRDNEDWWRPLREAGAARRRGLGD